MVLDRRPRPPPTQVNDPATANALTDFLEQTFPARNAALAYRNCRDPLGPYTPPPPVATRSPLFGKAFEALLSVTLTGWPDTTHLAGVTLPDRPGSGGQPWPDLLDAVANHDLAYLAPLFLDSAGIPDPRNSQTPSSTHDFDAQTHDLVALIQNALATLRHAQLADEPTEVDVEDILCGHCLIDLKVHARPALPNRWLTAIAHRVLNPQYRGGLYTHVEEVAIYAARHDSLLRWPINEFLDTMAGKPVNRLDLEGAIEHLLGDRRPPIPWQYQRHHHQLAPRRRPTRPSPPPDTHTDVTTTDNTNPRHRQP